ncbi:50S ribosomal protein L4 [Candidatus Giovannonibacteria bacterium]|nr:50S ribosomal protein L4 [Candidatus Giovannonibacteria bacterium]
MEVKVYNQKGDEVEALKVEEKFFSLPWNPALVYQVSESERANKRKGLAHAKGRGEVRGGGKKPWRQKGTGRARHGSIRSPIWIGGGVTHGPTKDKDYEKKINKRMKRKALLTVLSQKLRDQEVLILDDFKIPEAKTKNGAGVIKNLSKVENFEKINSKSVLVLLPEPNTSVIRSLRNIKNIEVDETRNINTLRVLSKKFLLMPKKSLEVLEKTFAKL